MGVTNFIEHRIQKNNNNCRGIAEKKFTCKTFSLSNRLVSLYLSVLAISSLINKNMCNIQLIANVFVWHIHNMHMSGGGLVEWDAWAYYCFHYIHEVCGLCKYIKYVERINEKGVFCTYYVYVAVMNACSDFIFTLSIYHRKRYEFISYSISGHNTARCVRDRLSHNCVIIFIGLPILFILWFYESAIFVWFLLASQGPFYSSHLKRISWK